MYIQLINKYMKIQRLYLMQITYLNIKVDFVSLFFNKKSIKFKVQYKY